MTSADHLRSREELAAEGDCLAMAQLGAHANRLGDLDTAHEWFFQAAETGDGRAAAYLGWIFKMYGSVGDAIHWTRIALERGDAEAPAQLESLLNPPAHDPLEPTVMMMNHRNRQEASVAVEAGDEDLAFRLLSLGDEWGDADAMFMFGQWWEREGTLGHAILYYQRAISMSPLGHSRAQSELRSLLASIHNGQPRTHHFSTFGPLTLFTEEDTTYGLDRPLRFSQGVKLPDARFIATMNSHYRTEVNEFAPGLFDGSTHEVAAWMLTLSALRISESRIPEAQEALTDAGHYLGLGQEFPNDALWFAAILYNQALCIYLAAESPHAPYEELGRYIRTARMLLDRVEVFGRHEASRASYDSVDKAISETEEFIEFRVRLLGDY